VKVFLAGCAEVPTGDGDDDALVGALADLGVHAEWAPWDSGADFASADLVVLRSTWDYTERLAEFLAWCDTVPALANPASVLRWNTDKSYMVELADKGVPIVPTTLLEPGDRPAWPTGEFVVKPAVGAGSKGVLRVADGDFAAADAHWESLGVKALVQPYQSNVDSQGESALVFFGGQYSHAFTKGAMLTDDAEMDSSGHYIVERLKPATPDAAQRRVAEDALDAASGLLGLRRADLLYARVDLVSGADGAPLLLELELSEPSLGFRQTDDSAPLRFASAVRVALSTR
jgi:glutathione synthase/RimK-type ligase-like ATP-grasp enzyme